MERLTSTGIVAALGAAATSMPAAAHATHAAVREITWSFEPAVLIPLGVALALYLLGVRRMKGEQLRRVAGGLRIASFLAGIGVVFIALESPIDSVADALFSVHMVQHLLLLLVAPPLLVAGRPAMVWLWAFDVAGRRAVASGWQRAGLLHTFRFLTRPLPAWVLLSAALMFWHVPWAYDLAVRNPLVHDMEHLCFLGFGLSFWTVVVAPYGRRVLDYGATMLYVISIGFEMGLIGAILTFAGHALYAVHAHTTATWGLTPLQDQQMAGVIMWIPGNMIHLSTLCALFYAWFRASEQRAAPRMARAAKPALQSAVRSQVARCIVIVPVALMLVLLAGCNSQQNTSLPSPQLTGGNPRTGVRLIRHYGCGGCHTIPGVEGANGTVAPPLTGFGNRMFIAGVLATGRAT